MLDGYLDSYNDEVKEGGIYNIVLECIEMFLNFFFRII